MKVKKMLTIWTMVVCSIVFCASVSDAAPKWHECSVLEVGLSEDGMGTYIIRLERSSGSRRCYEIPSGELNRCLSIALTAASAGMEVLAYVDWADTTGTGDLVGLKLITY